MLETPLVGRFAGEGRRLSFAAPAPYHILVRTTAIVGAIMLLAPALPIPLPLYESWWTMVGAMLVVAAVAAALSLQTIVFDTRERTYRRRQGPGFLPRFSRGRIDELDAIVVLAEQNPTSIPPSVTFHVVLHWKGNKEPLMVLQRDTRSLGHGMPLNSSAGHILALAQKYATALNVKFFDNTYFPSPCPVPIWR